MPKKKLLVCTRGKSCRKRGGKEIFCALEKAILNAGLGDCITLKKADCLGYCSEAPAIKVKHGKRRFGHVKPEDAASIIGCLAEEMLPAEVGGALSSRR